MATPAPQRKPVPAPDSPEESTQEDAAPPQVAPDLVESLDARTEDTPAQDVQPTDEDIRLEAYLLHIRRGGGEGRALEDWLEAERRLRQRGSE